MDESRLLEDKESDSKKLEVGIQKNSEVSNHEIAATNI